MVPGWQLCLLRSSGCCQLAVDWLQVLLNYIDNRLKFWVTWPFALAGAIICWIFVADLTGMDLMEQASAAVRCTTVCQLTCRLCAACKSQADVQDVLVQ